MLALDFQYVRLSEMSNELSKVIKMYMMANKAFSSRRKF